VYNVRKLVSIECYLDMHTHPQPTDCSTWTTKVVSNETWKLQHMLQQSLNYISDNYFVHVVLAFCIIVIQLTAVKRNFNAVLITSVKWTSNANIQWTVGTKVDVNVNQNEGYTEISLEFLPMPALSDDADKALRCVCWVFLTMCLFVHALKQ